MNQTDNTDKYLYNTVAIHDFNCGIFLFISKMIYWIFHVIIISNLPNLIYNFYFFFIKRYFTEENDSKSTMMINQNLSHAIYTVKYTEVLLFLSLLFFGGSYVRLSIKNSHQIKKKF